MPTAYLSLGSNLGDREKNLSAALFGMDGPDVQVMGLSSLYETVPVGETATPVPMYLNLVARVHTNLTPTELLSHLQAVEQVGGRERTVRWGARTIDIDILLYDNVAMNTETLTIPHPRMYERAFVLAPLEELTRYEDQPDGKMLRKRLADPAIRAQNVRFLGAFDLDGNGLDEGIL